MVIISEIKAILMDPAVQKNINYEAFCDYFKYLYVPEEVRAPILDHHVIEFASSIPANLKYNRGEKKYILKKSFNKILPQEVMYRKKMGFSVPLADWLREELKTTANQYLFAKDAGLTHFFRAQPLKEIWDSHQSGKRNYATILWSLLMFELWYQEFMA